MAKCVYCHQKKGKRSCPALRGEICTGCCGEHRTKEIRCPEDCRYLASHESYQRERTGELFAQQWGAFEELSARKWGEKGRRFAVFLTLTLYRHFVGSPAATDAEALAGLGFLRKKLSPIHMPQTLSTPFGDLLAKETESFLKQVPIDAASRSDLLEDYLKMLSDFSGGEVASNRLLRGVVGFVQRFFPQAAEAVRKESESAGRIVRV
jgi:hypothetical protein